jgi:hypothetical protein
MQSAASGCFTDGRQERRTHVSNWQRQVLWAGCGISSGTEHCGFASNPANQQVFCVLIDTSPVVQGKGLVLPWHA